MPTGIYLRTEKHLRKLREGLKRFYQDPIKSKQRAEKISKNFNPKSLKNLKSGWNKGKSHSEETKRKMKEKAHSGSQNHKWKGDKVGYRALHNWIETHKPKTKFCEKCGKKRKLDASNISGKYKRDINDFEWLCRKCHLRKDRGKKN